MQQYHQQSGVCVIMHIMHINLAEITEKLRKLRAHYAEITQKL